jgi:hypothetical protein
MDPSGLTRRLPGRSGGIQQRLLASVLAALMAWPASAVLAQAPSVPAVDPNLLVGCAQPIPLLNGFAGGMDYIGHRQDVSIPSGGISCFHYFSDDQVGQLTLDVAGLAPADAYRAVVALRTVDGQTWTLSTIPPGEKVQYCFNVPGEDIAELYLLISNTSPDPAVSVTGTFRSRPAVVPCGRYAIHTRYAEYEAGQVNWSFTVVGELSLSHDPIEGTPAGEGSYTLILGRLGLFGSGPAVAQGGGLTAAAADGGAGRGNCRPPSYRRYTGRTTITVVAVGGTFTISVLDRDPRELSGMLMNFVLYLWDHFGWVGLAMGIFWLLLTVLPLMLDLLEFQLGLAADMLLNRMRGIGCDGRPSFSRNSRTVVRLSDR